MAESITLRRDGVEAVVKVGDTILWESGTLLRITPAGIYIEHKNGGNSFFTLDGKQNGRWPQPPVIDVAATAAALARRPAPDLLALAAKWREQADNTFKHDIGWPSTTAAIRRTEAAMRRICAAELEAALAAKGARDE